MRLFIMKRLAELICKIAGEKYHAHVEIHPREECGLSKGDLLGLTNAMLAAAERVRERQRNEGPQA